LWHKGFVGLQVASGALTLYPSLGLATAPGTPAARAEEAMDEAHIPAEQPPSGAASRVPSSDVDARRARHHQGPPRQGPPPAVGLTRQRRDPRVFEALRREGQRVRRGPITVTWLPGGTGDVPQVAFAIGRKVGGAVVRNRVRRRLRAVTAELSTSLRPGAYLLGASREAATVPYRELRETMVQALRELGGGRAS
jgi:ribonuclease P protein component